MILSSEDGQKLFIAGAGQEQDRDVAWFTSSDGIEYSVPELKCNAEEADTRVWLHANYMARGKKLIFSPDTDVYHVGFTNVDLSQSEVIVQLSVVGRDLKLLHMNNFMAAINTDPNLSSLSTESRPKILQMLYIATGCDFTSFFVGLGKTSFLKAFFAFSELISGGTNPKIPGSLSCSQPEHDGFLAFIRLVGVTYYAKHRGAFFESSPVAHFNLFSSTDITPQNQHRKWYSEIRSKVWERILYEDKLPPSIEALELGLHGSAITGSKHAPTRCLCCHFSALGGS